MTIPRRRPTAIFHPRDVVTSAGAIALLITAQAAPAAPPALASGDPASHSSGLSESAAGAQAPGRVAAGGDDPMQDFRAPLLREGSMLVEAQAHLKRDPATNWWLMVIDSDSSLTAMTAESGAAPPHELTLLPCTRLSEMERIMASAPAAQSAVRFQVSGRVYVYGDRNYFLPTHAAVISEAAPPAASLSAASAPGATPVVAASAPAAPPNDDSAEAIARALEKQAGPLARSSGSLRGGAAPAATRNAVADAGASPSGAARSSLLQENTAVINRRGKITRDRAGGWLLVFDADASGLADPPMRLLPCMLLQNIEDYARRQGNNSPIIVTGQVYLYNGQNHLLPTVYRIPKETSRLTP